MKHIVTVTYSDPGHEFISLRGRTQSTNYVVEARDIPEAQNRASSYFRSMGYKIHSAVVNEQKMENLAEGSQINYKDEGSANEAMPPPNRKPDPAVARSIENAPAAAEKARLAANAEAAAKRAALKSALVPKSSSPPPSSQITKQNGVVPKGSSLSGLKKEETQYIEEKLKVSDGVDTWIHDFVHSDNPKFEGKSKKERIQQALGAYYAAKREGHVAEGAAVKPFGERPNTPPPPKSSPIPDPHSVSQKLGAPVTTGNPLSTAQKTATFRPFGPGERFQFDRDMSNNDLSRGVDLSYKGTGQLPKTTATDTPRRLGVKDPNYNYAKEEVEQPDPSNILAVIKAAAKSKTLAKQASPKIELGLSKDNPVNAKGPKDEDITEAVEKEEKGSKKEALNKEVDNSKTEVAKAEKEQDVKKKQKPKVIINPEGGANIPHMALGSVNPTSGGMPGA